MPCHAVPLPCSDLAALQATSQSRGRARQGHGKGTEWVRQRRCELAFNVPLFDWKFGLFRATSHYYSKLKDETIFSSTCLLGLL
jgi:hypothetical protein